MVVMEVMDKMEVMEMMGKLELMEMMVNTTNLNVNFSIVMEKFLTDNLGVKDKMVVMEEIVGKVVKEDIKEKY